MNIIHHVLDGRDAGRDGPDLPRVQPIPVLTRVGYLRTAFGQTITTIMRQWDPGDSGPGGRCRLCPRCFAHDDGCMQIFLRHIPRREAPLFDAHGFTLQDFEDPPSEGGGR